MQVQLVTLEGQLWMNRQALNNMWPTMRRVSYRYNRRMFSTIIVRHNPQGQEGQGPPLPVRVRMYKLTIFGQMYAQAVPRFDISEMTHRQVHELRKRAAVLFFREHSRSQHVLRENQALRMRGEARDEEDQRRQDAWIREAGEEAREAL